MTYEDKQKFENMLLAYSEQFNELREKMYLAFREVLSSFPNSKIDFGIDGAIPDYLKEYIEENGYPYVFYNGGNHPEYASGIERVQRFCKCGITIWIDMESGCMQYKSLNIEDMAYLLDVIISIYDYSQMERVPILTNKNHEK